MLRLREMIISHEDDTIAKHVLYQHVSRELSTRMKAGTEMKEQLHTNKIATYLKKINQLKFACFRYKNKKSVMTCSNLGRYDKKISIR